MRIELNMYLVPLSQDKFAIVDTDGWEKVKNFKWYYCQGYATRQAKGCKRDNRYFIRMHRFLTEVPYGMDVDHINGDKIDNRMSNLRICTRSENLMNSKKRNGCRSKYKGVGFSKVSNKWRAYIQKNGRSMHLGLFINEEEAARAYNEAAKKHFGEFARLNEV